ncbi:MAG TPA: sugar ABC transporter ATP-binding protein [Actinomycetota bacterium]|nr:sugar ABC transporter ATP-binding protein [Actinomycetota bacterium]
MLYPGEIHALVGENGAGKSTLIKVMTGIHSPDAGTILLDGEKVTMRNSAEAQRNGIAAIYQEPAIFPDLNVAENIFIGHRDRAFFVRWRDLYHQAEGILARLDVRLDVGRPARGLAVAEQQAVEIAKAISLDVRVLVMDEPTAALSAHEVSRLFDQVRRLAQSGVAVLFISHRIDEVFAVADRLTVLRDGRLISTRPKAEATPEQTVKDMVGRDLSEFFARSDHSVEDVVLTVEDMAKEAVFSGVNFELRSGEILGLAGLVGAGRTDVALALFGIAAPDSGVVKLNGRPISIQSPQHAMRNGIAYLSEDRRRLGLSLPQSIAANITLSTLRRYTSRLGLLNTRAERKVADRFRDRLRIRTSSVDTPVEQLSGGNQQKTMLAKWLNSEPTVLILDEPTRGIDVGAKAEVHQIIESLAKSGIAIVLISSDLPEVIAMSDRVLVMREGHQVGIFAGSEATEERIVAAAVGAG